MNALAPPPPAADAESLIENAASQSYDVLIAGAGPAGALAAALLARRGARVLLVDKAAHPRWKVCGCCLNGSALAALDRAGLGDLAARLGAVPLDRFELRAGGAPAVIRLPGGMALSREALDWALIAAAVSAGATFVPQARAVLESPNGECHHAALQHGSTRAVVSARIAVAADGLAGGFLKNLPQFEPHVASWARLGAGAVLDDPSDDYRRGTISMACAASGYVGAVRLEDGRLNLAAAIDRGLVGQGSNLPEAVTAILRSAGAPVPASIAEASWQGTPLLTRHRPRLAAERVFLIGDAAGYVEPFSGEGMAWGMQAALVLVPLVCRGLAGWEDRLAAQWATDYARLIGRRQRTCRLLTRALRGPRRTRAAVVLLRYAPWLAAPWIRRINSP